MNVLDLILEIRFAINCHSCRLPYRCLTVSQQAQFPPAPACRLVDSCISRASCAYRRSPSDTARRLRRARSRQHVPSVLLQRSSPRRRLRDFGGGGAAHAVTRTSQRSSMRTRSRYSGVPRICGCCRTWCASTALRFQTLHHVSLLSRPSWSNHRRADAAPAAANRSCARCVADRGELAHAPPPVSAYHRPSSRSAAGWR